MEKFLQVSNKIFWIILPSFFYLTIFVSQELCLYSQQAFKLEAEINHYQRLGWDLTEVENAFQNSIESKTLGQNQIINYLIDEQKYDKNIDSIEKKLHQQMDDQQEDLFNQIGEANKLATIFHKIGIEVDTTKYEAIQETAYRYIQTDNAIGAKDRIAALNAEIISLSEAQDHLLEEKVKETLNSIKSLEFIASEINLDLSEYQNSAITSASSESSNLEKYQTTEDIELTMREQLNQKFIERGGQVADKRILIDISEQHIYMIEDSQIIYNMPASTGVVGHETKVGEFQVYDKIDMAWGYYEIWMPYWLTIYYAGSSANGIHGIPLSPDGTRWSNWDQVVGVHPITYGCIMPHDWDAERIYNWAEIGTPVTIVY